MNNEMKIETLSIVAGSRACNAQCPFCVSRMTPKLGFALAEPEVNWRNFRKACLLAKESGVVTAMITGKGEPTIFPGQITKFMKEMRKFEFPFIELQTNGILLGERFDYYNSYLKSWYDLGLTTVAISVVHYLRERNKEIYQPHKKDYIDLPALINYLHSLGLSVRLSVILLDGFIDGKAEIRQLIEFARKNQVEQITIRPVNCPQSIEDETVGSWTKCHFLKDYQLQELSNFLETEGVLLMKLPYGATVYDVDGQNVCLTNSLTLDKQSQYLRQLIFFPDGHLRYDWRYQGAILL